MENVRLKLLSKEEVGDNCQKCISPFIESGGAFKLGIKQAQLNRDTLLLFMHLFFKYTLPISERGLKDYGEFTAQIT